jgi:hypothetical protein
MGTTPSWTSSGDGQTDAYFGISVASAGDVNGDGYDDVIVGAHLYDAPNPNAGKAYLYLGSSSGLQTTPSWTSSGDAQAHAYFGISVASAGDVNGDGYDDVVVGAQFYDTPNANAGKAYLYLGSSLGLQTSSSWTSSGDNQEQAYFGISVAGAGDVNGDGYDDVVISASHYDSTNPDVGKSYLYLGSSFGLGTSPSWTSSGDDQANASFGVSVAGAGDVNGDGYDDIIIGAYSHDTPNPDAGKAYLYLGSSFGLQTSPSWTSMGDNQTFARFGCSVASAGDVNGDGYGDIIIGAHGYNTANTDAGKAYLYLGNSFGLQASASWTSSGDDQAHAYFGVSVAGAGDVNSDGYSDVIVGAHGYDTVNTSAGKAYLYLGSSFGLQTSSSWASSGNDQANASFGSSVASASDVNGDENSDVIIGACSYDTANIDAGKAYLFLGVDTSPATPTGLTVTDASGDEGGALNITWDANTELDLDHYTLYSDKTGSWEVVAEISEGTEYYLDTGLNDGTRYYYNISASDDAFKESAQSATASGVPADDLPPATPTGLTITSLRSGDLNIAWNLNTDDTQTYSIYSNKTGTWTLIVNIAHPQNWHVDIGLTSGITYYYRISAWDEVPLESSMSGVVHGISSPIGTISGTVEGKDGNPIEGVTVTIYEDGTTINPVTFATTNSNGEYSVDIAPGTYDIKIEKSGYETQWKKDVVVTADQITTVDSTLPFESDFLREYWWLILMIIIVIVTIIIVALKTKKKKKKLKK